MPVSIDAITIVCSRPSYEIIFSKIRIKIIYEVNSIEILDLQRGPRYSRKCSCLSSSRHLDIQGIIGGLLLRVIFGKPLRKQPPVCSVKHGKKCWSVQDLQIRATDRGRCMVI